MNQSKTWLATALATSAALLCTLALPAQTPAAAPPAGSPAAAPQARPGPRIRRGPPQPPPGWTPQVPAGFHLSVYAQGLTFPRWMAVAPNGDIFVANAPRRAPGDVVVLRGTQQAAAPETFADHLTAPFGIAFHGDYVYVGENNELVRFRYDPKTSRRLGGAEHLLDLPAGGQDITRTVAIAPDGKHLLVTVGDFSDYGQRPDGAFPMPGNPSRAAITECDFDGQHAHLFATGIRNPVGLEINPQSGQLWMTVIARDDHENLPNDYMTRVHAGEFFGWPYSYLGQHVDDKVQPQRPDLVAKAVAPDFTFPAHVIPMEFQFYSARQFPAAYRHGAFVTEHGPGNTEQGLGFRVVYVPFANGMPSGSPTPFLTGFNTPEGGRGNYGAPVGLVIARDGSLLVSDDTGKKIWRISYGG
jgi:glucose/arabinose dehydrogenase